MRRILIFAFCLPIFCTAQTDSLPRRVPGFYTEKRMDLALGYNFYFGKKDKNDSASRKYHFLELGIWRSR